MKNLKFGVDRANIEQDQAPDKTQLFINLKIYNRWMDCGTHRPDVYVVLTVVNFGVFEWLYLVQYRPDKHQTWE